MGSQSCTKHANTKLKVHYTEKHSSLRTLNIKTTDFETVFLLREGEEILI
jgi:hypothetical protein